MINSELDTLTAIEQDDTGYFFFYENGVKVILYLSDALFPDDNSLEKLKYICNTFPVDGRIIGLPDLHFKIKNFVPSGMTIPLRDRFSPKLLGPNNDGMGAIRFSSARPLEEAELKKIFYALKERLVMFRRKDPVVSTHELEDIFLNGITNMIGEWGFEHKDLNAFEDRGCTMRFDDLSDIKQAFPKERPELLPDFVPGHDLFDRGMHCLGVLDGTSHFIELFRHDETLDSNLEAALSIQSNEYFMLIHAGAGDVGLLAHRAYLEQNDNLYTPDDPMGSRALHAFLAAGNYGFANRLYMYREIKTVLQDVLSDLEAVDLLSDCPHDYLSFQAENNQFIHRKGAVKLSSAATYDSSHPWHKTGTPYLFPSAVGGNAYIVVNPDGNTESLNTVSHGAGRLIKKDKAIEKYQKESIESALQNSILLFRYGVDTIEGQNPKAFKNVNEIMRLFRNFNLATPVSKLVPLASLKA